MMCPAHISETLEKLKNALKDDTNEVIRVVSTQLIEAGVDIDFLLYIGKKLDLTLYCKLPADVIEKERMV